RASRPRRPPRPTIPVRTCILRRLETQLNLQRLVDRVSPLVARLDAAATDPRTDSPAAPAALAPGPTATSPHGRHCTSPRPRPSGPARLPRGRSNSHHRAFRLGAGFLVAFLVVALGSGFRFVPRLRFATDGRTGVDLGSAVASAGGGNAGGGPKGGAVVGGGK